MVRRITGVLVKLGLGEVAMSAPRRPASQLFPISRWP